MVSTRRLIIVVLLVVLGVSIGGLSIDASGDGLQVSEDLLHKTDPFETDTDGDGLTDYEEVREYGTDPTTTDSDSDRLSDYEEVHEYRSDPMHPRTDRDHFPDYDEVHKYGTDPSNPDTDDDGLPDHEEIRNHDTDPLNTDTDGDGLTDDEEVDEEEDMGYSTDPTESDTDGDGLSDYEELREHGTDPRMEDSRGTGMSDARAVELLIDPMENPSIQDTEALQPYFEQDNNIHGTPPITSSDVSNDGVDSSGDGFSDAFSEKEDNLTTDEIDLFVEVGYQPKTEVPVSALLRMQQVFADAPVQNAHGEETGINLHFYVNPDPSRYDTVGPVSFDQYERGTYTWEFTSKGYGSYHMFIVNEVPENMETNPLQETAGLTRSNSDGMLIQDDANQGSEAIMMHELGHQLGLWDDVYRGIDSISVSSDAYPSVMNYNVGEPTYSDGEGFDDWDYIEEHLHENVPGTWMLDRK